MSETQIAVAEMFYSIQGEGPHAGQPAIFLRLAGCNLSCGWNDDLDEYEPGDEPQGDANWVCDTIDVWKDPEHTYTPKELLAEWRENEWDINLEAGAHIVLTGGEPTLPSHQDSISEFFQLLKEEGLEPTIEVETNGTQDLIAPFGYHVDHYNVSLKLSNSGMSEERRLDPEAILQFTSLEETTAVFKFVVGSEEDLYEAESIVSEYLIPREQVSLMPAGQRKEQLAETYPLVAEFCKKKGYKFSPRLHVNIWDEQTGV